MKEKTFHRNTSLFLDRETKEHIRKIANRLCISQHSAIRFLVAFALTDIPESKLINSYFKYAKTNKN